MVRKSSDNIEQTNQLKVKLFRKSLELACLTGGIPAVIDEACRLYAASLDESQELEATLLYLEDMLPMNAVKPNILYDSLPEAVKSGEEKARAENTIVGVTVVFNNLERREIHKAETTYAADLDTAESDILSKFAEVMKREPIADDVAKMELPGISTEALLAITKRLTLSRCFADKFYQEKRLELFEEYSAKMLETGHYGSKYDKSRTKAKKHFFRTVDRIFANTDKRLSVIQGVQNLVPPQSNE